MIAVPGFTSQAKSTTARVALPVISVGLGALADALASAPAATLLGQMC